jgi:soluble cytochrome b562
VALDASNAKTHVIVGAADSNNATGAAYEYRYSTPAAELANAIKVIEHLVRARTLMHGEGDVLIAHLNAAAEWLDQGSLDAARRSLRGFVEMVASYAEARILSPTDAQRMTAEVDWVFGLIMR